MFQINTGAITWPTISSMASSNSTPPPAASPGPGTTARTRQAILDAAITALSADHAASLADIAKAAGVGRSTLHRYFPDRTALLRALIDEAVGKIKTALEDAALHEGTPDEAFRRMITALFDFSTHLLFLFNETPDELWEMTGWEEAHSPMVGLFIRGQQQGAFDPSMTGEWFVRTLWYMMSAGWEAMQEECLPRYQAAERVYRTMRFGMSAPPGPEGAAATPDTGAAPAG